MTKDNSNQERYPVVIVGGGPAGIATALTLNALGVSNCVVEANKLPTRKYGEALPPNSKPILKQLGILSLVDHDAHLPYYGNQISWGSDQLHTKEFISELHGHGYLLNRLYFEEQLWDLYCTKHGKIYNGFRVKEIGEIGEIGTDRPRRVATIVDKGRNAKAAGKNIEKIGGGYDLVIGGGNEVFNLRTDFLVDATGRKSSISQKIGGIKQELDSQYGLTFTSELGNFKAHNILVESVADGWWYVSPNGNNTMTVMFFTLKKLIPAKGQLNAFLDKEFKVSKFISKYISSQQLKKADVKIIPAGTSRLEKPYGNNWLAVGDAACAYDPISSYGITSALASGYYAGQAIASKLSGKTEAMDAYRYIIENAFQAYDEKLHKYYRQEQRWKEKFYWRNRFVS